MLVRGLIEEDFLQYKEPSMFIIMPWCSFKCNVDAGKKVCQNSDLQDSSELIEVNTKKLVEKYMSNPITKAVVFGGLEPFDSFRDIISFITELRKHCNHTVVIYTGYRNDELKGQIEALQGFPNIIVKFGRYIPDQEPHFDEVLGVNLRSLNQYRVKIS